MVELKVHRGVLTMSGFEIKRVLDRFSKSNQLFHLHLQSTLSGNSCELPYYSENSTNYSS